jgi:hypothetical protein
MRRGTRPLTGRRPVQTATKPRVRAYEPVADTPPADRRVTTTVAPEPRFSGIAYPQTDRVAARSLAAAAAQPQAPTCLDDSDKTPPARTGGAGQALTRRYAPAIRSPR